MSDLLTVPEAAERLRCSPWFVARELRAGRLRGSLFAGSWKTSAADLEDYLVAHANRVQPRRRPPP